MSSSPLQEIVCCIGQPVAGNPTQFMMERAFAAAGLDWRYLTFEVTAEHLDDAVRGLRAMGFCGANFAHPHKVSVLPRLDHLTEAAQWIGAVNCVYRQGEKLVGENTDGKGFVQSLRELLDPTDKRIVILGAGGAARAIAVELASSKPAEITIVNRSERRGLELVSLLTDRAHVVARSVAWQGDFQVAPDTNLVINATTIGMGNEAARLPIDVASLQPEMTVADVTFNPPQTRFLREAESRGCTTLNGLGMLVHQTAICFKIWTGVEADRRVLQEALEEYLEI